MNYQRIYDEIIKSSKNREVLGYYERHHIIPKSMGGSNEKTNIAKLTAREHYICHWLLYKIHRNQSMAAAWHSFIAGNRHQSSRYTSHTYVYAKRIFSNSMKERWKDPTSNMRAGIEKSKAGLIKYYKDNPMTNDHRKKIADGNHSNVQWTITFGEQTYLIMDNVNKWAKNFGISHNVLFDALKRTNSVETYKDKSNTISGSIKQGKFKGLLVTRSPA